MENAIKEFLYRVGENDTLLSISTKFKIPFTVIIADNGLTREVEFGDVLLLKRNGTYYTVQLTDTVESIAEKFNLSVEEFLQKNRIDYVFYGLTVSV